MTWIFVRLFLSVYWAFLATGCGFSFSRVIVNQHWTQNERQKDPLELNVFGMTEMCLSSNLRTDSFSHSFFHLFWFVQLSFYYWLKNVSVHEYENSYLYKTKKNGLSSFNLTSYYQHEHTQLASYPNRTHNDTFFFGQCKGKYIYFWNVKCSTEASAVQVAYFMMVP
jgi:hypothetical protein